MMLCHALLPPIGVRASLRLSLRRVTPAVASCALSACCMYYGKKGHLFYHDSSVFCIERQVVDAVQMHAQVSLETDAEHSEINGHPVRAGRAL